FARAMTGGSIAPVVPMVCTGPVKYIGDQALRRDIDNLKAAMAASGAKAAFMPSVAPSGAGTNEYYKTDEEFFFAVADAMREEIGRASCRERGEARVGEGGVDEKMLWSSYQIELAIT